MHWVSLQAPFPHKMINDINNDLFDVVLHEELKTFYCCCEFLITTNEFFVNERQKSLLYFRGQKIWQAILTDLLPKGLANAEKVYINFRTYLCMNCNNLTHI